MRRLRQQLAEVTMSAMF
ncbi:hypothetical protein [Ectopseudomonas toyotomiensis]